MNTPELDSSQTTNLTRPKQVADELQTESDKLRAAVNRLDKSLEDLALGIQFWIDITPETKLGYCKKNGSWGLSIRHINDVWKFNEAPRQLRIEAVPAIDILLKELLREAEIITRELKKSVTVVDSARSLLK